MWSKLLSPLRSLQRLKGILPPSQELPENFVLPTHPLHMELATCLPFELEVKKRQKESTHINVKELRGMIESERIQAHRSFPSRVMSLGDSQVACAVWVKGRGASIALNQELQQSLPIHLGCSMISHTGFVPSELNAADDPTRHVPVRAPWTTAPDWLSPSSEITDDERHQLLDEWLQSYRCDPFSLSGLPPFSELQRSWDADLPLDRPSRSKMFLKTARYKAKERVRKSILRNAPKTDAEGIPRNASKMDAEEKDFHARTKDKEKPLQKTNIPEPLSFVENPKSPLLSSEAKRVLERIPRSWFHFPKGFKPSAEWLPSRQGYLDLYSGKKGVARQICEVGSTWAICFELEDDPSQNLDLAVNRRLVLDLIQFGSVFACGSAIFCASFSRAVRPPVRSKDLPEGLPVLTSNMEEKVRIGNSHSDFNSEVYLACQKHCVLFWIENPDGSYLWLQPKWVSHGANLPDNCLRIDYCRFGCPWRKRTRVFTSSHLAGQSLFCSQDHGHQRLVGWSAVHRRSWTKVAQVYPKQLCHAIALALLIDGGLVRDRQHVSIASIAKQSHGRIGEAANPGPRRPRAYRRDTRRLADSLLVESTTEALGSKIWEAFRRWSLTHVSLDTFQALVSVPQVLGEMIEAFGFHLFEHGASLYLLRQLITFVQRNQPGFRFHLGKAWQLVSRWEALEPVKHRTPLPVVVYRAMVVTSLLWGWKRFAAIIIIGFEGICRPGEPLAACRSDLLLPKDLIAEDPTAVYLRIRNPKGRRRGLGREQHTKFTGMVFADFLQHVYGRDPGDSKLYPGSAGTFRRRWDSVLQALGIPRSLELTPASLRPGGAVKAYREDIEMNKLLWRMRLRNLDTLQHYLQEIGAMSVLHELSSRSLARVQFCSQFFEDLLQATSLCEF